MRKMGETLSRQIELERVENTRILSYVRVFLVSIFFILHLLMGWGVGLPSFQGKEIIFLMYLLVALLLCVSSERSQHFRSASTYALSFVDIPFTYLILQKWASEWVHVPSKNIHLVIGVLAIPFMMLMVQLSGFYFSVRHSLLSSVFGCLAMYVLAIEANVPRDTIIVGMFLIICSCFIGYYLANRFKALVRRFFDEQNRLDKMTRYFSPSVVDFLLSSKNVQPEGKEMDVTVLFVDIRDFTQISEKMTGHEVVRLLNSVHEKLVACVFESKGTLDKYIGDGLMAYFGAPVADPQHADRALDCAEMMKNAIRRLNQKRAADDEKPLTIGIGLHSGRAIVGDVGAEFRREYTVIGDTVNTASRVEALTKKHSVEVLATDSVLERLSRPQRLRFVAEDIVRGRSRNVKTYTFSDSSV